MGCGPASASATPPPLVLCPNQSQHTHPSRQLEWSLALSLAKHRLHCPAPGCRHNDCLCSLTCLCASALLDLSSQDELFYYANSLYRNHSDTRPFKYAQESQHQCRAVKGPLLEGTASRSSTQALFPVSLGAFHPLQLSLTLPLPKPPPALSDYNEPSNHTPYNNHPRSPLPRHFVLLHQQEAKSSPKGVTGGSWACPNPLLGLELRGNNTRSPGGGAGGGGRQG